MLVFCAVAGSVATAPAAMIGLWQFENSGTVAGLELTPNSVLGGVAGVLNGGPTIVNDATRGNVIETDGSNDFVDAGFLAPLSQAASDFTWSFWAKQPATQPINNDVVLGNRFGGTGGQWVKFTPRSLEYNASVFDRVDYADIPSNDTWIHHAAVKSGGQLTYYRDGVPIPAIPISGSSNLLPFFIGGDAGGESWQGRLDDVAIFDHALTASEIQQVKNGDFAGVTAQSGRVSLDDDFGTPTVDTSKWNIINKGLESTADGGYDAPSTAGGVLTLGGTTSHSYWAGSTLQSVETFTDSYETTVTVDRVSLSGSGDAYRSSLWIWADDGHYLHFSQDVGEAGWQYNWNDVGGLGGNPVGSGGNISLLDPLDDDTGLFNMKLVFDPSGTPGEVTISMYLDNVLAASQGFTNWSGPFQVLLTGQAWGSGNTVSAVFDNLVVSVIPEPSTLVVWSLLAGLALVVARRRRS